LKWHVHERLKRPLHPPLRHALYAADKRKRTFIHVPQFLDEMCIQQIHALQKHPSVGEIRDRKASLEYRHVAYRVELPLRAHARPLYDRLLDLMAWADGVSWRKLSRNRVVYPEVEYIVYDARDGKPGTIEPHTDNHAAVTMVTLLSDPREFAGGANCFAPASSGGPAGDHRMLALQRGDVVLFRGEKLRHWIKPVTGGVRTVLQIELSRI